MIELLKSVEVYRADTSEEADEFIVESQASSEYGVTKSVKEFKTKKNDEFYLVTISKNYEV